MLLPPYLADTDGDGRLGPSDQQLVETALFSHRGFDLVPRSSFDFRADVFGQGYVDPDVLDSVAHSINTHGTQSAFPDRPPDHHRVALRLVQSAQTPAWIAKPFGLRAAIMSRTIRKSKLSLTTSKTNVALRSTH